MDKSFSDFVKIADKTVFNDERAKSYFDVIQKSAQGNNIDIDQVVAALSVEIRQDILSALKAYHDWISS
mgnify:CR=1 FL=1